MLINHLLIVRITLVIKEVTRHTCGEVNRPVSANAAVNLEEHRPLSSVKKTA